MKLDLLVGDNIKISLDYSPENQLGLLFVRLVQEISNLAQGPAAAQVLEEAIEDVKAKKLNSQTLVLSSSSQVPPNANNYQSANARQLPQNYQNVLNESYSNTARPQTQNSLRDQQTLPQPPLFEQALPQPQQRQFSQQQNANIPQQPLLRRRGQSDVMQYSQVGTNPNVGIRTDRNYSNGIVSQGNMSNGQQPMQGVLQHQPPLPPPRHPQMPNLSSQQVVQQYQRQLQQHLGQPDVQNVAKPQPVDEMTQLILDVCSQDADKRQKGADTLSENLSDGNESDSFRRQFVNKFVEHVIALDGVHAEECIQLLKKTGEMLGQEIMGRNSQVVRQLNHILQVEIGVQRHVQSIPAVHFFRATSCRWQYLRGKWRTCRVNGNTKLDQNYLVKRRLTLLTCCILQA
eukprot:TRINITY_DN7717_c0_g2_i2.p2 TRINITY_DN7717_c0_g2~~TRINITY_DN7717_c0_g2_i2.p2  ORF type:complete len:402 (-),score=25.77 TRINITY_DN7717_c0_g2_i2:1755-2960(-)